MINFDVRVETLKGVGTAMAIKLERLGIATIGDLLTHYPRRYDDFSEIIPIRSMKPGLVTFKGTVERIASRRVRGRKLQLTEAIITDGTGTVKAVWFNQSFLAAQHPVGTEVFVAGKVEFRNNDLALQSPAIEKADSQGIHTGRIVPVYPETDGLTSRQLRNLIAPLLPRLDDMAETLPASVLTEAKLLGRSQTLIEIHAPTTQTNLQRARHRLAFEELFYIIGASLIIKNEIKTESADPISLKVEVAQAFTKSLDFDLTNAQRAAAWQILQDMQDITPMNRLLEGDVGSGKTVVALLAASMVMASGHQVALMVPTDILARQHAATIEP
ncbi:MAG TPA: DEAD/DEAH box helicase, partial [Candidatus Saccharimonadia bacterium]